MKAPEFRGVPSEWAKPSVIDEIAAEWRRQVEAEGWTPEHDDTHAGADLGYAAASYVLSAIGHFPGDRAQQMPGFWPWGKEWWKPSAPRRDLVKAAALIVAEIERLDRASPVGAAAEGGK